MGRPRKSVAAQAKDSPKTKAKETKEPEEETENLSLTLTRSRRTPKPNPKYSNDVIVPFSSKVVTGDSSRSTTPAKSETSEEVVPLSEEDEEESPKAGTRKRGRPAKKVSGATPPTPEPAKKTTPQTKVPEKKEPPPRRLPERATKQAPATETPSLKRKREEEEHPVVARVDAFAKKRIKALEEKLRTPTPPKPTPPPRPVEKRPPAPPPAPKNPSPAKGEIIDVAGTRENVKIVDVTEILNKKHEVEEPKRLRKCPPEAPKGARPLYSSKILSQSPKVAPKLSPVSPRKVPMINRQLNNGKLNVPRFPEVRKMPPLTSRCPVIDLTTSEGMEKPKRALKEALAASARKPQTPLRPVQNRGIQRPPLVKPPMSRQKREITCIETWHVVQLPVERSPVAPKVTLGVGMKELKEQIKDIRLPSDDWSHVEEASSVAFQRSKDSKKDRSVMFKATDLIIEIDGHEVTLVGAPESLTTAADIQTLLQIVDDVSLRNSCVEQVTVVL